LEIRDGCNPIIQFCELHDGKHRHVMEWLQQIPKVIKPVDIEALGWSEEQLAAEDKEAMESSPLCRELGDGTGPIVLIGEEKPTQPTFDNCDDGTTCKDPVTTCNNEDPKAQADTTAPAPAAAVEDASPELYKKTEEEQKDNVKDCEPKADANAADNAIEDQKQVSPEKDEQQKAKKKKANKGGKKKGSKEKGKTDEKSDSGSSEEQTSSITLSGGHSASDQESSESSSESTSDVTGGFLMSSSTDPSSPKRELPPAKRQSHHHKDSSRMRSTENGKTKKPPVDGKKSKNKPKP